MLRYLKYNEIDFVKWDRCIQTAPNAMIYGFSWYLDIISPNWHAIVKEEAECYTAVMPIPIARKFGLPYVKYPVFAQQLGLFYTKEISKEEWLKISQLLKRRVKIISRYSFNTNNENLVKEGLSGFNNEVFTNYHLSLAQSYEQIVSGYRKDRRWRINKSKRSGLSVRLTKDINLFLSIFDGHVAPKIPGVIGEEYEYRILRQLFIEASNRGMALMYEAVNENNQVEAMALFFLFNKKMIFLLNCSTPEGKKKGAVALILDSVFQEYAGREIIFDFEAPEVEHLVDFYSSFGSKEAPFLSMSLNELPAPIRFIKEARMIFYKKFLNKIR